MTYYSHMREGVVLDDGTFIPRESVESEMGPTGKYAPQRIGYLRFGRNVAPEAVAREGKGEG